MIIATMIPAMIIKMAMAMTMELKMKMPIIRYLMKKEKGKNQKVKKT